MISLKNITKKYGDKVVYENFCLDIEQGKKTVILGESGSGKTTLMNILMKATDFEGEILNAPESISVVFQTNVLVPSMTVGDNIRLVKEDADVESLLKLVGLENNQNDYIKKLSAGMKRRVAILRALAVNAEMLLLDEPFINLDLSLKNHLNGIIKEKIKQNNQTLVMITHDVKEAVLIADRIVVISQGKIIFDQENLGEQTEKQIYDLLINLKKY